MIRIFRPPGPGLDRMALETERAITEQADETYAAATDRANHTGTQSADTLTDGTTNKAYLATERTKLAGIATGATANSPDATLLARANHTGTQSADTLTDGTTNKAFLATERTKLAGIATGATANSSDATLLNRANHTGSQAISTVTGLQTALDAKAPLASPSFTGTAEFLPSGGANAVRIKAAAAASTTAQQWTNSSGTQWAFEVIDSSGNRFYSGTIAPSSDNVSALGGGGNRWSVVYAATGAINTSDQDAKQAVGPVPDEWLDAWADVQWARYKFNDAVADKGFDEARWHIGGVAQQIRDAFLVHGLDGREIGLLCYDEWPEMTGKVSREAGSRWGLRYDECFAMEAAYQRRRMDRIEAQIAALLDQQT